MHLIPLLKAEGGTESSRQGHVRYFLAAGREGISTSDAAGDTLSLWKRLRVAKVLHPWSVLVTNSVMCPRYAMEWSGNNCLWGSLTPGAQFLLCPRYDIAV